jgi:NTE family protein
MLRRRAHSRIGLVLGGGAARGWAHIGAIRALHDAGIKPDVVCGTSIGALVAAVYANGDLDWLEDWVSRLTWWPAGWTQGDPGVRQPVQRT